MTQQDFLREAATLIREDLIPEAPAVDRLLLSYSLTTRRGNGHMRAVGECHSDPSKLPQGIDAVVFVHPLLWTEPVGVLSTIAHELIHAATPGDGHGSAFGKLARRIGFTGPLTATVAGPELAAKLAELAEELGDFPAAGFDPSTLRKKQTSRQRLFICRCSPPVKVRAARDILAAHCDHCGEPFTRVGG